MLDDIQRQVLYPVFNAMLIRLEFKAPFGIESQSLKFKEVSMTAITSMCGIRSNRWHSMSSLGSRDLRIKSILIYLGTSNTKLVIQSEHWD